MSKKMSQFDGSVSIDGFASTVLVFGSAILLFLAVVGGLVGFQANSSEQMHDYEAQSRKEREPVPQVDILGPQVNAGSKTPR